MAEKTNKLQILTKGFLKENPVLVLFLGLCPTLGTTTSAINGLGMGLATTFVLFMSNIVVSSIKTLIPDKVRIPSYIVVIASFVTLVELVMHAYTPTLYEALGLFIPLIVVNCIILGRAEAFASKNNIIDSALDGLGMGLGFTIALTILGSIREILGNGTIFGLDLYLYHKNGIITKGDGILAFVLAPGAFLVLGYMIAVANKIKQKFE